MEFADYILEVSSFFRYNKIRNKETPYEDYKYPSKVHWNPIVINPEVCKKLYIEKTVSIATLGNQNSGNRVKWTGFLEKQYPNDYIHYGAPRLLNGSVSAEEYYTKMNQAKIMINFQVSSNWIQLKAKVNEALACGTFLLEEDNIATRAFVEEGTGVVYFKTEKELKEKIDYYLEHEEEREAIALKGYNWFNKNYTAKSWTYNVLKELELLG